MKSCFHAFVSLLYLSAVAYDPTPAGLAWNCLGTLQDADGQTYVNLGWTMALPSPSIQMATSTLPALSRFFEIPWLLFDFFTSLFIFDRTEDAVLVLEQLSKLYAKPFWQFHSTAREALWQVPDCPRL